MNVMSRHILSYLLIGVFVLNACATNKQETHFSDIEVLLEKDQRMRFSGRGAGAGAMLSASMGPVGIAIGIAIDEGIAKDLDERFLSHVVDHGAFFNALVKQAIQGACLNEQALQLPLCMKKNKAKFAIKHYGFVVDSSNSDNIVPKLVVNYQLVSESAALLDSQIFTSDSDGSASIPLDTAKEDGELLVSALTSEVNKMLTALLK